MWDGGLLQAINTTLGTAFTDLKQTSEHVSAMERAIAILKSNHSEQRTAWAIERSLIEEKALTAAMSAAEQLLSSKAATETVEARFNAVCQSLKLSESKIAALKRTFSEADLKWTKERAGFVAEHAAKHARITALTRDLTGTQQKLTTANDEYRVLQSTVADLTSQCGTHVSTIAGKQKALDELTAQVAKMELQLQSATELQHKVRATPAAAT